MSESTIKDLVMTEGLEYLGGETDKYLNDFLKTWKLKVSRWLATARKMINQSESLKNAAYSGYFSQKSGKFHATVGYATFFASNQPVSTVQAAKGGFSLEEQVNSLSLTRAKRIENYSVELLMKDGYRILVELGEFLRGDQVNYKVLIHNLGSIGKATSVIEFTMGLEKFLDNITVSAQTGKMTMKSSISSYDEKEEWNEERIKAFRMFEEQVKGYFLFHGKEHFHPFANINYGYLLEGFLNSDYQPHFQRGHEWRMEFEPAVRVIYATVGGKKSDFVQGGEGGKYLQNTQVKANSGNLPDLKQMVTYMTRIFLILSRGKGYKTKSKIGQQLQNKHYLSDSEIIDLLAEMFGSNAQTIATVLLYI